MSTAGGAAAAAEASAAAIRTSARPPDARASRLIARRPVQWTGKRPRHRDHSAARRVPASSRTSGTGAGTSTRRTEFSCRSSIRGGPVNPMAVSPIFYRYRRRQETPLCRRAVPSLYPWASIRREQRPSVRSRLPSRAASSLWIAITSHCKRLSLPLCPRGQRVHEVLPKDWTLMEATIRGHLGLQKDTEEMAKRKRYTAAF